MITRSTKGIHSVFSFKKFVGLTSILLQSSRANRLPSTRSFVTYRRMRIERDSSTNTVTFFPAEGNHSATVILMHGLGDSADGLSDLADAWAKQMPHTKFILPTADQIPVTLNGGMRMNAWYDIVGLDDRASESCEGIESSVERIKALLSHERSLGLPYSRMMLAGFSQGGAMSLFTGLQLTHDPADGTLAGLVVMSGYLPGASKFKLSDGHEHLPVLHAHGEADPVVKPAWAKMTEQGLKAKGMSNYNLKTYRGVGHTISMDMLADCGRFLLSQLPHDPSFAVKPKSPAEMSIKELKQAIRQCGLGAQAASFYEKQEFVKLLEDFYAKK